MTIYHQDGSVTVHHGDCLDVLPTLPDNSIDAIVTDPQYGLSSVSSEKIAEVVRLWTTGNRNAIPDTKGGFMSKSWDAFVPPPAVWDECLRVLKPGGHLLCFAGTRMFDLATLSIRLAGFEIRDSIGYGATKGPTNCLDCSHGSTAAASRSRWTCRKLSTKQQGQNAKSLACGLTEHLRVHLAHTTCVAATSTTGRPT
jgi:hypothetical protein